MFYNSDLMFGPSTAGLPMPRPQALGLDSDRGYYYLVLAVVVVCTLFLVLLHRMRLGRLLRGLGDSPIALETSGASVRLTKLIVFSLSAAMAAVAGALYGSTFTNVGGLSFQSFSSLTLVVLLLLMPGSEPWYAVLGAFALVVLPTFLPGGEQSTEILTLVFGLSIVVSGLRQGRHPALPRRPHDAGWTGSAAASVRGPSPAERARDIRPGRAGAPAPAGPERRAWRSAPVGALRRPPRRRRGEPRGARWAGSPA